jgi:hypothetical protein
MPILYIAGPYSAPTKVERDLNIAVARNAALQAWENGWAAITPHLNTARFDDYIDLDNARYIAGDLEIIQRLDPKRGDALYMLPGWLESTGAQLEFRRAFARGLSIHIGAVPRCEWGRSE